QRLTITMRDVEGLSSSETCAALDVSEGNQRVLLHRARSRVRAALEDYLAGSGGGSVPPAAPAETATGGLRAPPRRPAAPDRRRAPPRGLPAGTRVGLPGAGGADHRAPGGHPAGARPEPLRGAPLALPGLPRLPRPDTCHRRRGRGPRRVRPRPGDARPPPCRIPQLALIGPGRIEGVPMTAAETSTSGA